MHEPNLLSDVLILQSKSLATNWILDRHVGKSLGTPPAKSSFLALMAQKKPQITTPGRPVSSENLLPLKWYPTSSQRTLNIASYAQVRDLDIIYYIMMCILCMYVKLKIYIYRYIYIS